MADLSINTSESSGVTEDIGYNQVRNGSFETAPAFTAATTAASVYVDGTAAGSSSNSTYTWGTATSGGNATGSFAVQFDNSTSNSGTYSFKMSLTATNSAINCYTFRQNIGIATEHLYCVPVDSGVAYSCSVWIKTTLTSGSATSGARANFAEMNSLAQLQGNHFTTSVLTTTGWTKYTSNFTVGGGVTFIWPQLQLIGTDGSATLLMNAWFDDISVQRTTPVAGLLTDMNPVVTPGVQNISGPKIWS